MFSKFTLTAVLFLTLMAHSAQAKIWTVSPRPGANFTTIAGAVGSSSVLAGDTILVSGAPSSYAGFTISKKLTIIGPGYFLGENAGLQADTNSAKISSTVTINAQGTTIMGMHFLYALSINADNVTIIRCRVQASTASIQPVYIYAKDSIVLRQNYITQSASYYHSITVAAGATQIFIQNNFVEYTGGSPSYGSFDINGSMTGDISNNIIYGDFDNVSGGFTFNNNILRGGTFNTTGVIPYNNIGDGTQFGTSNGNQQNVNMSSVFLGTGSSDAKWQLSLAGGPASNAGFGGVDCGMFENSLGYGYVLSGIPAVPSIYLFNTSVNGNNLDVTVNVKSNN